ncbi:hypothetical protein BGZ73_002318 [Actinomortierella ambigua]|nr:hypothetical protein BGZ73_002318 [Actinomortierella ambigua]
MARDRSLSSKASPLVLVAGAILLLASTVHAGLSCQSPSGSARVGDQVTLSLSDNGWWPKTRDVYSMKATFRCSSGNQEVYSTDVSPSSGSFTIPSSFYGACPSNQIYAEYSGIFWDLLHLTRILRYSESCGSLTISPAPAPPPPPPPPPPTHPPTQPPPVTKDPEPPTNPPNPTQQPPVTQPPRPTNVPPPVITKTTEIITLIPTVISGTSTLLPTTIIATISITETSPSASVDPNAFDPNATLPPGLPPSDNNNSNKSNNADSHIPIAALASVAGIAALALIVFGFVMTRKRRRIRRERAAAATAALGGDGGSAMDEESGAVYGCKMTTDEVSMPSLIHTPFGYAASPTGADLPRPLAPAPAGVNSAAGLSGYDVATGAVSQTSLPDSLFEAAAAAGAGATAVAFAAGQRRRSDQDMTMARDGNTAKAELDDDVAAFPVPSTAHPGLIEELERANQQQQHARFSVASQESMVFPMPPGIGPDGPPAIAAMHAPLTSMVSLSATGGGHGSESSASGAWQSEDALSYLETGSATTQTQVAASPASMFRTMHSNQSSSAAYVTATEGTDGVPSPVASPMSTTEICEAKMVTVPHQAHRAGDWRQSGRPESAHIRNLIRNVLDDDDD